MNDRRRRRFQRRGYSDARIARIFTQAPPRRVARQVTALRSVLAAFAPVHADVEVIVIPA